MTPTEAINEIRDAADFLDSQYCPETAKILRDAADCFEEMVKQVTRNMAQDRTLKYAGKAERDKVRSGK